MNWKKQLTVAASAATPMFMFYFGYKYTIFKGKSKEKIFNLAAKV